MTLGVCCCGKWKSGQASSSNSPAALRTIGIRTGGTLGGGVVAQRIYGLALGYKDLNDHEELRRDPLLAVLVEKRSERGKAAAGQRSGHRLGGQEHPQPYGTGGGEVGDKGAV